MVLKYNILKTKFQNIRNVTNQFVRLWLYVEAGYYFICLEYDDTVNFCSNWYLKKYCSGFTGGDLPGGNFPNTEFSSFTYSEF